MNFYFNKIKHNFPFKDSTGSNYRKREFFEFEGSFDLFDSPNEQIRELLHGKKQSSLCKVMIVSATGEENEFLESESSFSKKNTKIQLKLNETDFDVNTTVFLTKNNFEDLKNILKNFNFSKDTYANLSIITVGGKLKNQLEIQIEGYCEGLEVQIDKAK